MAKGCDSATTFMYESRAQELKDEGYVFIGRYLNRREKVRDELTAAEIEKLNGKGLYIVALYEAAAGNDINHFTKANGKADAREAVELAENLGVPGGYPIYFCVDTDVLKGQIETNVVPYVQGVLEILEDTDYKLGVYGSKAVCKYIRGSYSATERYMFVCDNDWSETDQGFEPEEYDFDDWNLRQYKWNQPLPETGVLIDYVESSSHGGGGWIL